jgi:hypothetical protein
MPRKDKFSSRECPNNTLSMNTAPFGASSNPTSYSSTPFRPLDFCNLVCRQKSSTLSSRSPYCVLLHRHPMPNETHPIVYPRLRCHLSISPLSSPSCTPLLTHHLHFLPHENIPLRPPLNIDSRGRISTSLEVREMKRSSVQ